MMKNIKIWLAILCFVISTAATAQSTLTIKVYGTCGMCKDRIETTALEVIGVNKADYNLDELMLTVKVDDFMFQEMELHNKLASVGHDTDKVKATDEVYKNLHSCCKYRPDTEDHTGHDHAPGEGHDEDDELIKIIKEKETNVNDDDSSGSSFSGMVYEMASDGKMQPLIGANVFLANTAIGTATDVDGYFNFPIPENNDNNQLVISYTGFANDTIDMTGNTMVSVTMKTNFIMDEVNIVHKRKSTEVSFINPIKVQNIGQKELHKAACCNLSESFETNPSVDASATDAVTGTKKIEMLGLAGPYVQVTRENMPYIRGLAALYGFSYTPGSWVEGIQLNMGAGSVVNGPESMTGQINVEIKKPELSEKLFVNLYGNMAGRLEGNLNNAIKINDKVKTGFLLHGNYQNRIQDRNGDNYQDMPNNKQIIAMNRWKYSSGDGKFAQFGVKGTYIDNSSGQINPTTEGLSAGERWRADVNTERIESWAKLGRVFEDRPYASVGLQLSGSYHKQDASFGNTIYNGTQSSGYANLIYQTIVNSTSNTIKFGASAQLDSYDELVGDNTYLRDEALVGAFTEYQYIPNDKWTFVGGLRADYHNIFGAFVTPRLHIKYNPAENTSFRLVAGRGQRTATIFAENIGIFASNREIIIHAEDEDTPYGLNKETAWNFGANFTKEFIINKRSVVFGIDYYYTTFTDQVVVDYDINPQEVHFYNLDGKSISHSIQTQIDAEVLEGLDVRLAYRYNNPTTAFQAGERLRPLVSKQRAFANIGWEIGKGWMYDITTNWQSAKRLPDTELNPAEYRVAAESPSFVTVNSQISKTFNKSLDIYLGGENIFDFRQEVNILSPENPFGTYFDSSIVWGPVQGRVVYLGMRYRMI